MSGDLRAAVERLPPEPRYKDSSHGEDYFWHGRMTGRKEVLALIPDGAVLVTEETLAAAIGDQDYMDVFHPDDLAAAILRHLREGT